MVFNNKNVKGDCKTRESMDLLWSLALRSKICKWWSKTCQGAQVNAVTGGLTLDLCYIRRWPRHDYKPKFEKQVLTLCVKAE